MGKGSGEAGWESRRLMVVCEPLQHLSGAGPEP